MGSGRAGTVATRAVSITSGAPSATALHLDGNAVNSVMLETYASTMNNLVHAVVTTTAVPLAETINIPFFSPRTS